MLLFGLIFDKCLFANISLLPLIFGVLVEPEIVGLLIKLILDPALALVLVIVKHSAFLFKCL